MRTFSKVNSETDNCSERKGRNWNCFKKECKRLITDDKSILNTCVRVNNIGEIIMLFFI